MDSLKYTNNEMVKNKNINKFFIFIFLKYIFNENLQEKDLELYDLILQEKNRQKSG